MFNFLGAHSSEEMGVDFGQGHVEQAPTWEAVRTADGNPLYYSLIDPEIVHSGILSSEASREAKASLSELFETPHGRNAVLSCSGKSPEEAREILNALETEVDEPTIH